MALRPSPLEIRNSPRPGDDPAGDPDTIMEKKPQGALGDVHGAAGIAAMFAQVDEIAAQVVLGEGTRIALEVVGQAADLADVLFFVGGR